MDRVRGALAGGAAATAVMSLVLAIVEVEARYAIGIFEAIARFVRVPGNPFLGFVIYAAAGVVAWPLLFVSLKPYVPIDADPAVAGMALATLLWVAFATIGRGDIDGPLLLVYLTFTLLAHLAYGFTLGAVYARLVPD